MMIDLTGKSVFVKTQEEYLKVLKMAKLQGFKWIGENHLNALNIPIPNMLKFYDDKNVTYYSDDKPLYEASEIVVCEEKIKEAIAHVKYFADNKYRMSLTDKVIESMLLLADAVESQMEEVKQMERLTIDDMIKALRCVASQDTEGDCYKDHENFKHMKDDKYKRIVCGTGENLKDWISGRDAVGCPYHQKTYGTCYEDGELYWLKDVAELLEELKSYKGLEEQGLLVRLPCKVGDTMYDIVGKPLRIVEHKVDAFHIDKKGFHLQIINGVLEKKQEAKVYFSREEAKKKLEEMKAND